jgi:hypothetical protein
VTRALLINALSFAALCWIVLLIDRGVPLWELALAAILPLAGIGVVLATLIKAGRR